MGIPIAFGLNPDPTQAGTFTVKNCVDEVWFHADVTYAGSNRVESKRCIEAGGIMHLNGRGGHSNQGEYGAWVWKAGEGSGILSASVNARLRNSGGWTAQLFTISHSGSVQVFGSSTQDSLFQNYVLPQQQTGSQGVRQINAQLKCYQAGGCHLNALGGATNRVNGITLVIYDWTAPSVSASGSLVSDPARWHHGVEAVSVHASDSGSGVSGWGLKIDEGPIKRLSSQNCNGGQGGYAISTQPCTNSVQTNINLDTSSLNDGVRKVRLCSHDYGADDNWGCSSPHTVRVDNENPLQPANLQVGGGEEAWHPDRDFSLSWSNPSQEGSAPLSEVHYRVSDEGGAEVIRNSLSGSPEQLSIQVPDTPGMYTVEVWLEDAAGNQGAAATATLRFDDLRPQPAAPAPPQGWLSRTEIPHRQEIAHPGEPRPVSGIAGYAISVDRSPGSDPCAAEDRCADSEVDLRGGEDADTLEIAEMPEGTSYVHSVAVSGSGMKSDPPRHTVLRVDKTDPVTNLTGASTGWSSEPVALTATAIDGLSGMEPGSAGDETPFTAISVDSGPPIASAGASVTTAVVSEGVHTIDHYARDLAGNVNDGGAGGGVPHEPPARATVRIDRSAPEIVFSGSQDPDDPELIVARVSDSLSGTDASRGTIAVRRAGSAEPFLPLPTSTAGGSLQARWESDSYPAGEYEFRATGFDVAGNSLTSSRRAGGGEMVLPNPLKLSTALRAGFGGRRLVRRKCRRDRQGRRRCARVEIRGFNQRPRAKRVHYGSGARVSGRLSAGLGTPLADMPIRLIERFPPGARPRNRVTTVKTGGDGVFTARLIPGPTRTVETRFPGTRTLTRAAAKPARLRVRGGLRLRVRPRAAVVGGRPVVFHGRVPSRGAAIPPDGKSVQLQYRLQGLPWSEFRTVQTNGRGVFAYRYKFSDAESRGVKFFFRAYAPRQSYWPFAPGPSNPVAVRAR